jgi:hypothetical protein
MGIALAQTLTPIDRSSVCTPQVCSRYCRGGRTTTDQEALDFDGSLVPSSGKFECPAYNGTINRARRNHLAIASNKISA